MTRLLSGLLFLSLLAAANVSFAQRCPNVYHTRITVLKQGAGRVDWSRSHGYVAYDATVGRSPYFDVHVMRPELGPDGKPMEDRCLTCHVHDVAGLGKHKGNPAWHPTGDYIVFQAEIDDSNDLLRKFANPGRGLDNVLWLAKQDGSEFWQLTWPGPDARGVLHPHFSEDGIWLSWTELYAPSEPAMPGKLYGSWRLKVAKLITNDGPPHLDPASARTFIPGEEGFYENHGFAPDRSRLIFSSNMGGTTYGERLNNNIFALDLHGENLEPGTVRQLTFEGYNEHASYFPSGQKILWMNDSARGKGTDLWVMHPDGVPYGADRLTYFNKRGCREFISDNPILADSSINAAGDKIVAYMQDEIFGDNGAIVKIELDFPL